MDIKELVADLGEMGHDPLGFTRWAFPWGEVGSTLEHEKIEPWQEDILKAIGAGLISAQEALQIAVSSGHSIGKSSLVSWIILWSLATMPDARGVVTANTATQLATKTWPELAKWHNMSLIKDLFIHTATAIYSADANHEKTWRVDAIPWSKTTTEAFAGLHNKGKRLLMIFDEASAIADKVWEVADGAMLDKDTELLWFAFGNPTRNTGRFYDCFHRLKHRWITRQIDSRSVGITDKGMLSRWAEDYGENSDFFKVRCRGEFPNIGDRQFISSSLIDAARSVVLHPESQRNAVGILTLDSAWSGGCEIVCGFRKGLGFKICWTQGKNDNDIDLARRLAATEDAEKPDAVFIDQGYGTGVFSYGKEMHRNWMLIPFGGAAIAKDTYKNKRAEMYGVGRQWIKDGGQLPYNDAALAEQIGGIEQVFRDDGIIQLEAKEDIIARVGDVGRADAWALSFAMPIRRVDSLSPKTYISGSFEAGATIKSPTTSQDWHPFEETASGLDRKIPL